MFLKFKELIASLKQKCGSKKQKLSSKIVSKKPVFQAKGIPNKTNQTQKMMIKKAEPIDQVSLPEPSALKKKRKQRLHNFKKSVSVLRQKTNNYLN